jgi:DNA polymerase III alpha subunit
MACCFDVVEDVPRAEPSRLSLYAQNETGYRRLMYLSSRAYLDAADGVPKLSRALVMEQTEGLIVLTGGAEGDVAKHLLKGRVQMHGRNCPRWRAPIRDGAMSRSRATAHRTSAPLKKA